METIYTFEKKKKLLERINKLTSRIDYNNIKKIILDKNKNLDSLENQNYLFLQFNYLTTETFVELTCYLDKLDKFKLKKLKAETIETSESMSNDDTNNNSEKNVSKKLRLTNTESHIINRIKYEQELKNNENIDNDEIHVYNPDTSHKTQSKSSDIFVSLNEHKIIPKIVSTKTTPIETKTVETKTIKTIKTKTVATKTKPIATKIVPTKTKPIATKIVPTKIQNKII
jgi:hypothetical protein